MELLDEGVLERERHPSWRTRIHSAPSLAVLDGVVHAVYRAGSAKVSPDGRIEAKVSHDGGRTWTTRPGPFDGLDDGTNHAGSHLAVSGDRGTVLSIAARFRMTAPGTPGWTDERAGIVDADAVIARRAGDGAWEPAVVVDARRHDGEWAIGCGPAVSLGDGTWLQPMERHDRSDRPDWQQRYHAFALRSVDDGGTWTEELAIPNDPTGRVAHYDQRMTVLTDDRLVTLAWAHDVVADRTLPARAAWSADRGATWSATSETALLGGPINPITLRDGRVLAAYSRRTPPAGIRVALSEDGGRTWPRDDEVVLYDGARKAVTGQPAPADDGVDDAALWSTMWGWTFGSPCPVELPDATVLVAFFAVDEGAQSAIRWARLRP